jgi:hypothetical protein
MNTAQFNKAFAMAGDTSIDLSHVDRTILSGCFLPEFQPTCCTIEQVARELRDFRWINGKGWDMNEVNNMRQVGRRKFTIVGTA